MRNKFLATDKIGQIVANFPITAEAFKAMNIDFCRGGNGALDKVAAEAGIDINELIAILERTATNAESQAENAFDALNATPSALIDYTVETHHTYLKKTLPQLRALTAKILDVHGDKHGELAEIYRLYSDLSTELDQHLEKEETVVFPLIKEYMEKPSNETFHAAKVVIHELEEEHEAAGDILKQLRKLTADYIIPTGVCPTYVLTYNKLEELESDIFNHVHLENNILIPKFLESRK